MQEHCRDGWRDVEMSLTTKLALTRARAAATSLYPDAAALRRASRIQRAFPSQATNLSPKNAIPIPRSSSRGP